jgi:aminoglycoside 3-N-acetyltransferase
LVIKKRQIIEDIKRCGLSKKNICIHSSYRSFGGVEGGPDSVVEAFLESGCTLIAPTFSFSHMIHPPENLRPKRNGIDYNNMSFLPTEKLPAYTPSENTLDVEEMGVISQAILEVDGRVRGSSPLCSFTGVGPYAAEIIRTQTPQDCMAPIRELALFEGVVLLAGVTLNKMTALHLAEQMAGRNLFLRWTAGTKNNVIYAETGGCSDGFDNLDLYINHIDKKERSGESTWRIFPINKMLKLSARVMQLKPEISHCKDVDCLRCNDAIAGGPII